VLVSEGGGGNVVGGTGVSFAGVTGGDICAGSRAFPGTGLCLPSVSMPATQEGEGHQRDLPVDSYNFVIIHLTALLRRLKVLFMAV